MLQQTQVDTVIPYWQRFIKALPTLDALAKARLEQVLKLWEGLGYYRRAHNLHAAAKELVDTGKDQLPENSAELKKLPGFGDYTSASVASIAFGEPVPAIDGNVLRVGSRFFLITDSIDKSSTKRTLAERLTPAIPEDAARAFNEGLMELGATVCTPKAPRCGDCPVRSACKAFLQGRVNEVPVRAKRKPVPHVDVAVAIVEQDGLVLISRRPQHKMLGGLWEFPGGKVEDGEAIPEATRREVLEETSLSIQPLGKLCKVQHTYTHLKVTLHAYLCAVESGEAQPLASDEIRWVGPDTLKDYAFPVANQKIIEAYLAAKQPILTGEV